MKIFITGGAGQLGYELQTLLNPNHTVMAPTVKQFNVTNQTAVETAIKQARPDIVIHAAAYTAVDQAEAEPDIARRVNVEGSRIVAQAAHMVGAQILAVSTDYVFDGRKTFPYTETDQPKPLNKYGLTKWEGEQAIQAATPNGLIFRTAWLFGGSDEHGNFVRSILKRVDQQMPLAVVDDQIGSPTAATDLGIAIVAALDQKIPGGLYHVVNKGSTSWFGFAQMILKIIGKPDYPLTRIATETLHQPAKRPPYSVLSTAKINSLGITLPDWQVGLENFLHRIDRAA